ncbi:phage head-tail adapter protein [Blautia hansenii]|uniref:phage head-tail adapter protein n=1 Tax=Blautia hansenii TaxID=1322 RepID=UPI0039844500
MSIARDMRTCPLLEKKKTRTPSGAEKEHWEKKKDIRLTVYKKNDMLKYGSERYNDASHVGLTYEKGIKAGKYKINYLGREMDVLECNPNGRLAVLILKEVDTDA